MFQGEMLWFLSLMQQWWIIGDLDLNTDEL
jgi:hypothetical protein